MDANCFHCKRMECSVSVSKYEERGYRVDCRPFTQTPEVSSNKQLVELVILTLNKGDIWKLTIKVTKKQVQAIKRFIALGQDETRTISGCLLWLSFLSIVCLLRIHRIQHVL